MVYSPSGVPCFCKKRLNGSEKEFGMWPDESPGRGSGIVPRYLRYDVGFVLEEKYGND